MSSKKISLFFFILVLLIFIINIMYLNLILPKKTFYHKEMLYQDYILKSDNPEIRYLFMGDSHAFHAVNPNFIPGAYNYATGAENYAKTFYKLRKVIYADRVKINTVVLELDPQTFSTRLTDETNLFNELEVYSKFTSLDEIKEIRKEPRLKLFIESKFPFLGNGKEFGILIREPEFNEVNPLGWLKNKGNFSLVDKQKLAYENYKDTFVGQDRISNISFEYFRKTIELAENNGINVVFIIYPYTEEYKEALAENGINRDDGYYDFIFEEVNSTIANYKLLDYSELFPEKDYLFGDPAHLNYVGAEIFSKKIYSDLEKLELKDNFKVKPLDSEGDDFSDNRLIYFSLALTLVELLILLLLLLKKKG